MGDREMPGAGHRRCARAATAAAWLAALLLPLAAPAWAQEDDFEVEDFEIEEAAYGDEQRYRELTTLASEIELGVLYDFSNDERFGNYTGLLDDRPYLLGNLDLRQRGLFGGGDDVYGRLRGLNLGLDSRFVGAEIERQGHYGLLFEFDQLPVFQSETAQTFFLPGGDENLVLPTPWTPGATGAAMTQLPASLREIDIDWDRLRYSGGGFVELPADLSFDVRYDHEVKTGQKLVGAMMGISGGNPRSLVVPEPLDYVTQQLDAALRYGGEDLQLSLGYYGSAFNNRTSSLTWQNPYTAVAGAWDPSAGFDCGGAVVAGCGSGRKGVAPDNWFHQVLASGGYNLPRHTRVTLSGAFGWMLQDENFLPYSVNSALAAVTQAGLPTVGSDLAALPRSSLDAEIFTSVVDFHVTSRPVERLDVDLGYHFDNRDNETPRDVYVYIRGDAEDQSVDGLDSDQARINLPYSFTQHRVDVDAGYEVWRRTTVGLGYAWELTERDFQEVEELTEHSVRAILRSQPWSLLGTRLTYAHAWRTGDDYKGNLPFIQGHTAVPIEDALQACLNSGLVPTPECPFENHPLLRKSYLADLESDEVKFMLTLLPLEQLSVGLHLNWALEDYHDSEVGLTEASRLSPGVDFTWTPVERITTHAFYSWQQYRTEQNGWSFQGPTGANPNRPFQQIQDPTRRWSSRDTDDTHTAGFGFDYAVLPDRLSAGADYVFADSRGDIDFWVGSALSAGVPYPNSESQQHNVSVHTEYRFTESVSMRVGYLFAHFDWEDWAVDGIGPTSLTCGASACVIGSGRHSEDYVANVVSWSLVYRFW
jgi:MtrB/PioB family decaheme-associated outer membrane protein